LTGIRDDDLLFFKLYHCRSLDSFQNHWPIIYTSAFENPA